MDATATTDGAAAMDRELTLRVPVDALTRYAGLVGLGTAILAASGILSSLAFLSAWSIPAPLMRIDPLTAALRADNVTLQVATLALTLFVLSRIGRWGARRGLRGRLAFGGVVAVVALLGCYSAATGQWGGAITDFGALAIVAGHSRLRWGERTVLIAFTVAALAASYATGVQYGTIYRDYPDFRTSLQLTTRLPVGGLSGAAPEAGGAWRYDGLYLVFRDGEAIYVSRAGAGSQVWIVPAASVVSVGVNVGSAR